MSDPKAMVNVKEMRTLELRVEVPVAPLPCPFCPSAADDLEVRDEGLTTRVFCRSCGAYGPFGCNVTQAIAAWNHQNPNGWDERLLAIEPKEVTLEPKE